MQTTHFDGWKLSLFFLISYLVCCPFEPRHLQLSPYFLIYFSFPYCLPKFVLHFCWWQNRYQCFYFIGDPLLDGFFIYVFTVFTHPLGWRWKKMAAKISVSGVVAPPITSGRTRRHRFLFLAHLKAGADFEPVFWNRSQLFLCGKRKNWFQSWNQPGTSTGPALVEKG